MPPKCVSPKESTIYTAADHLYPAENLWAMYNV